MAGIGQTCLGLVNEIEYNIFLRDGNIDNEIFEKLNSFTSESCDSLIAETKILLHALPDGDYKSIFHRPFARHILGHNADIKLLDYQIFLKENVSKELLLTTSNESNYFRQLNIFLLGVSCLQLLIQQNWTGPPLLGENKDILRNWFQFNDKVDVLKQQTVNYLRKDGEDIYILAEFTEFLLVARTILVDCTHLLTDLKILPLWKLRCNLIHQQLLDEPSSCLKAESYSSVEKIFSWDLSTLPREILCRIHLECGYCFLQYFEDKKAQEQFEKAQECLGFELYHEGALGKRTKFQQIDYTQLLAKARIDHQKGITVNETTEIKDYLPKDVLLDDDTLLSQTKFTDSESTNQEKLGPLHLAAITAVCFCKHKSHAHHELLEEEILANVTLLLSQPQVWIIQTVALLLRSKYEKNSTRRKERSMLQVQELVDQYRNSNTKVFHRLKLFYSVFFPARWTLEKELADLFRELQILKTALEIYERLQLWEDVIGCYIALGRYQKAEEVVRQQLSVNETPKLWCLLGDVTKTEKYYNKAWELSDQHSARAQRSLGYIYLREKKFAECVPCFQKSLEINSLQENVWFSLGCAAMFTDNLELAAKAFQWCVSLNHDNSEAWNNLSSVYVKTKQKNRAFKTIQEALKSNYNNWHVWENFLVVSIDVGAFEEVITALHRLMDLKEKYLDIEILRLLVSSVINGTVDQKCLPASRLKPKLLKLLGRITSQVTSNSDVWKFYSDLYKDGQKEDEKEKFLQYLVKSHSIQMQKAGWEKTKEDTENMILLTLELSQAYNDASQRSTTTKAIQLLSSSKLNLKGLLTKVKNNFPNMTEELQSSLCKSLADIEEELDRTLSRIQTLKSAPS